MTELTMILFFVANALFSLGLYFHARATASREYAKIYQDLAVLIDTLSRALVRKDA